MPSQLPAYPFAYLPVCPLPACLTVYLLACSPSPSIVHPHKQQNTGLSLITWQMVQGAKPFQGMSRKDFFHHVVHRHFRPPVDPRWPTALSNLIVRSWDPDQLKRPTAREYVSTIENIIVSLNRHRRNSTGNSSSLARMRTMFQMMKERAEDYVIGTGGGRRSSLVENDEEQEHEGGGVVHEAFVHEQPQHQEEAAAQQHQQQRQRQQAQQQQEGHTASTTTTAKAQQPATTVTAVEAAATNPPHQHQRHQTRGQPSPSVDVPASSAKVIIDEHGAAVVGGAEGVTGAGAPHKRRNSY